MTSERPKKSARSGEHQAIKEYRSKLDSVERGGTAATNDLDRQLKEFMDSFKATISPKPTP